MNVSLTDVSPSQKKIQVQIPESKVTEELQKRYRDLAKKTKVKGFRPGKVPLSIVKSYYGKAVEQEASTQLIQDTFEDALKETDLKPLTQADISESHFEEDGAFTYTALVDICPPFELADYKELKVYKPAIEITDDQVGEEMEKLVQGHAQLRTVEGDRPIGLGDVAIVDVSLSEGNRLLEKGKSQDLMVEVGKGNLHPNFDEQLLGHKPGESLSFELKYPEDAPTPDLAGKTIHFDLTIKDLKEKEVPELNDDFAQSLASGQFDTLEALRDEVRGKLHEREEQRASQGVREQVIGKLLDSVQFEISPKVVEQEAERMLDNLKRQFQSQGLQFDPSTLNSEHYKNVSRLQAERDIRTKLVLEKIGQIEGIALDSDEEEQVFIEIAAAYRMDLKKFKSEFEDSALVENARGKKLEDKVLKFIENEAVFVDTPEEAKAPDAEAGAQEPEQV